MLAVMAFATSLLALEDKAPTFAPPYVIAGIAAVVFIFLGYVTFSYKNVAHRRPDRRPNQAPAPHEGPIDEFGHAEEH